MPNQDNYHYQNILVVIDPTESNQPALERALASAELDIQPTVHLFIGVDLSNFDDQVNNPKLYKHTDELSAMLRPLEERDIAYTAEVCWASPWQEAIIVAAREHNVDFILVPDYSGEKSPASGRERIFQRFSDTRWALVRNSPCPVFFVRPNPVRKRSVILAAVKTQTVENRYDKLNDKIISRGKWLASLYNADFHVVNAYPDSLNYPDRGQLRRFTDMDASKVHVKLGNPEDVIASTAREIDADIVVVGTLARKGMMAAVRGNTSEKAFNKLSQDIFTVTG